MYKRPQKRPASNLERPQRSIERQQMMLRWWRALSNFFSRPLRAALLSYRPLLWRIKRLDAKYQQLTENQLDQQILQLRTQLRRKGLTDKLLVEAFATVREVAGRSLKMRHFDVQILGGLAILHGNIAQMQTGEGKTLTATLPVAAAAMAGGPGHVITVNDYLTGRDAQLMTPVYQRLGLSVGVIVQGMQVPQRREQYARDIVYCTANELAFDYLKDSIELADRQHPLHLHALCLSSGQTKLKNLMLRGLHFAVVDEADSVLLDEARTPLIISGEEVPQPQQQLIYQQAMQLSQQLQLSRDYKILLQKRQIEMTSAGELLGLQITAQLGPFWQGRIRRLELLRQALTARHLFVRDRHYLVDEQKVVIIDEHTGRLMPDRTWERGLHQLIEIKENCPLSAPRETLASISFQNFFRHFHQVSGMTGTASEVSAELWRVYALPVVNIPTNRDTKRLLTGKSFYRDEKQQWQAVCEQVSQLQKQGRAVLVGTASLATSEALSAVFDQLGIVHQLLNARQDEVEAQIIECAGEPATVTIATSMAGRGTDIKLDAKVEASGGLHVIITGLHESSRIDRQLQGRCARQGDRGSYQMLLSLEDEVLSVFVRRILMGLFSMGLPKNVCDYIALLAINYCQRRIEADHVRLRSQLLKRDDQQKELLSFSGQRL
ncbi:MAG: SecA DEAD domain protein/helicase, putative [Osedax symbiont Rs2]|nr:MAG: SecA DEAD domain protein/helicase, putative [Osedax symbiont Rs2]